MNNLENDLSLAQISQKLEELKIEINGRKVSLKNILASKNITASESETLLALIQKVESEFSLNKNEVDTGKNKIATSITNKGISASGTETLTSLSEKIDKIKVGALFT